MLAVVALSFASCEKETEGVTRITIYPVLELDGESTLILEKGSTFEDPGYTATLDGEDVTEDVVVVSNVDMNKSGIYTVAYSITNVNGFSSTASRKVIVLDSSDEVEGFYTVTADSYRIYYTFKEDKKTVDKETTTPFGATFEILVINQGDGSYFVSDLMGGWYCQRAGYGEKYALEGTISINDDKSLTHLESYIAGWGNSADDLTGTYDAAKHTFTYVLYYGKGEDYPISQIEFHVTMNKN